MLQSSVKPENFQFSDNNNRGELILCKKNFRRLQAFCKLTWPKALRVHFFWFWLVGADVLYYNIDA